MYNQTEALTTYQPIGLPFVDRSAQVDTFNCWLQQASLIDSYRSRLWEYNGIPGIGKTSLVGRLAQECRSTGIPFAVVDIEALDKQALLSDPTLIQEQIVTGLTGAQFEPLHQTAETFRNSFTSLEPDLSVTDAYLSLGEKNRLYDRPVWLDSLWQTTREFQRSIKNSSKGDNMPSVVFLDGLDAAQPTFLDGLEFFVVDPLLGLDKTLLIATANKPWRWKNPGIRSRLITNTLENLSSEDLNIVLDQLHDESVVPSPGTSTLYELTGGYPAALSFALQAANKGLSADETTKALKVDFIDGFVLVNEKPEVKRALELLSLVRLFDNTLIHKVLSAADGEQFAGWRVEEFSELSLSLRKTSFLISNHGLPSIDPSLKYLISRYYRLFEPETYLKVNQIALDYYANLLQKPLENRAITTMEYLFHQACIEQVQPPGQTNATITAFNQQWQLFANQFKRHKYVEVLNREWQKFLKQFGEDLDLQSMLGTETINQLIKQSNPA